MDSQATKFEFGEPPYQLNSAAYYLFKPELDTNGLIARLNNLFYYNANIFFKSIFITSVIALLIAKGNVQYYLQELLPKHMISLLAVSAAWYLLHLLFSNLQKKQTEDFACIGAGRFKCTNAMAEKVTIRKSFLKEEAYVKVQMEDGNMADVRFPLCSAWRWESTPGKRGILLLRITDSGNLYAVPQIM